MKRLLASAVAFVFMVAILCIPAAFYDLDFESTDMPSEDTTITSYKADFTVDEDGGLDVVETLRVNFPVAGKHGIFRFFDRVVPTEPLAAALESAAYRGVKVRLLLSKISAHMATVYAAQSYYESLLRAGVEIYEYERGLLHSKTLTIDGCWSLIGSPNFDARSLLLNFEVGVVMYDTKPAHHVEQDFEEDIQSARRLGRGTVAEVSAAIAPPRIAQAPAAGPRCAVEAERPFDPVEPALAQLPQLRGVE